MNSSPPPNPQLQKQHTPRLFPLPPSSTKMGCLMGCFGLSSKRKRRKTPSRILPRDQGFGSYEQLNGSTDIESNEETMKKQAKEPLKGKIRKKVSFNLNVMAYEPISSQNDSSLSLWVGDEDGKTEEIGNKRGKTLVEPPSSSGEDPTATNMVSYPSNYRYRNCIDDYEDEEEEEEDFYDDSDLDSYEDYEEEVEGGQLGDIEEVRRRTIGIRDEQASQHFSSLQMGPNSGILQEKSDRERSQFIHPVLNPVENLAQWKEIKSKGKQQQQKKENTEPMLLPVHGDAVNSSLSNWLASPPVNCQSKIVVDRSCAQSWRRREESLGITDITNLST